MWLKADRPAIGQGCCMVKSFLFRCRDTGMIVPGVVEDDTPLPEGTVRYEWVRCPACGTGHLVDPETGSLLVHTHEKVQTIGL